MKNTKDFINDCATETVGLFVDGVADPSAKEIALRVWGEEAYVSAGMIEDVRKKLNRIRSVLHEDGYQTCPLSGTYYRKFRGSKRRPKTRDDARRCSAGKQEGLLSLGVSEELDIIWREHKSWQANSGASKAGRALGDVRAAVTGGKLAEENGHRILTEASALAQLDSASALPELPVGDPV